MKLKLEFLKIKKRISDDDLLNFKDIIEEEIERRKDNDTKNKLK